MLVCGNRGCRWRHPSLAAEGHVCVRATANQREAMRRAEARSAVGQLRARAAPFEGQRLAAASPRHQGYVLRRERTGMAVREDSQRATLHYPHLNLVVVDAGKTYCQTECAVVARIDCVRTCLIQFTFQNELAHNFTFR